MKMKTEDLIGKRILIKNGHPHEGEVGTVVDYEKIGVTAEWGFRVDLDNGGACYVFHDRHMRLMPQ
jgi:hypothetical protein